MVEGNFNMFSNHKKKNIIIIVFFAVISAPVIFYLCLMLVDFSLSSVESCSSEKIQNSLALALKNKYSILLDKNLVFKNTEKIFSTSEALMCSTFVYNTGDDHPPLFYYQYDRKTKTVSNLKISVSPCDGNLIKYFILNNYLDRAGVKEEDYDSYVKAAKYHKYLRVFETTMGIYPDIVGKTITNIETLNKDISHYYCKADIIFSIKDRAFTKLVCPVEYEIFTCTGNFSECYSTSANINSCKKEGRNESSYEKYYQLNKNYED